MVEIPTIQKDKNILEAIPFLEQSMEYVTVIYGESDFFGIVTTKDIMKLLKGSLDLNVNIMPPQYVKTTFRKYLFRPRV